MASAGQQQVSIGAAAAGAIFSAATTAFLCGARFRSADTNRHGTAAFSAAAAPARVTPGSGSITGKENEQLAAPWYQEGSSFLHLPREGAFPARDAWERAQDRFSLEERKRLQRRNDLATARATAAAIAANSHPCAEAIGNLPVWTHEPRWPSTGEAGPELAPLELVDTVEGLSALVRLLRDLDMFALDVESYGRRCFYGLVCTLQIATTSHGNFLVDALAVREALREEFAQVCADPTVLKVLHGCEDDVYCLQRDFGIHLVNVFDTMVAAVLLGRRCQNNPNFNSLLDEILGLKLDKKGQREEDWTQRPLPVEMTYYAVADAHYLLPVAAVLWKDAHEQQHVHGRQGVFAGILEGSSSRCLKQYSPRVPSMEASGAVWSQDLNFKHKLNQVWKEAYRTSADMRLLKRLYLWRDMVAREEDESASFICSSQLLFELARSWTDSIAAVQAQCNKSMAPRQMPLDFVEQIAEIISIEAKNRRAPDEETVTEIVAEPEAPVPHSDPLAPQTEPMDIPGAEEYAAAHAVIFDRELKVTLVCTKKKGQTKEKWNDVGGKPEPADADPWATVVREAWEETGWDLTDTTAFHLLDTHVFQGSNPPKSISVGFLLVTRREKAGHSRPQLGDKVRRVQNFDVELAIAQTDFRGHINLRQFQGRYVWSNDYDAEQFWTGLPGVRTTRVSPPQGVVTTAQTFSFYRYTSDSSPAVCLLTARKLMLQVPGGWRLVAGRQRVMLSAKRAFQLARVARFLFKVVHGRVAAPDEQMLTAALVVPAWPCGIDEKEVADDDEAAQTIYNQTNRKMMASEAPVNAHLGMLCRSVYESLKDRGALSMYIADKIDTTKDPFVDTFQHREYGVTTYAEFFARRHNIDVSKHAPRRGMLQARHVCDDRSACLLPQWTCLHPGVTAACVEQLVGVYDALGFESMATYEEPIAGDTPSATVFVKNISFRTSSDKLTEVLEPMGAISARIITDKYSHRSKGFGLAEFSDEATAKRAVAQINELPPIDGWKIYARRDRQCQSDDNGSSDRSCWAALALGLPLISGGCSASLFDVAMDTSKNERLAKLGDAVVELAAREHAVSGTTGSICKRCLKDHKLFSVLTGTSGIDCPYCVTRPMKTNQRQAHLYKEWLVPALQIMKCRQSTGDSVTQVHKAGDHVEAIIGMCAEALSVHDATQVYLQLLHSTAVSGQVMGSDSSPKPAESLGVALLLNFGQINQLKKSEDAGNLWSKCVLIGEAVTDLCVLRWHYCVEPEADKGQLHQLQRVGDTKSVQHECLTGAAFSSLCIGDSRWATAEEIDQQSALACVNDPRDTAFFLPECWKAAVGCLYLSGNTIETYTHGENSFWDIGGGLVAEYVLNRSEGWGIATPQSSLLMTAAQEDPTATTEQRAPMGKRRALRGGRGEFYGGNQIKITDAEGRQAVNQNYRPFAGAGATTATAGEWGSKPRASAGAVKDRPRQATAAMGWGAVMAASSDPVTTSRSTTPFVDEFEGLEPEPQESFFSVQQEADDLYDTEPEPEPEPQSAAEAELALESASLSPQGKLVLIQVRCKACRAVICSADLLQLEANVTKLAMGAVPTLKTGVHPDEKQRKMGMGKALCVACGADVGPTETDDEGREFALLKARKKPKVEIVRDGEVVPIAIVEELQGGR